MESLKPVRLAYSTYEPATVADKTLAPIIYIHGVAASKENWGDIPQKVADTTKRKSYTVDTRNHGDSEWSDHSSLDLAAEDLVHFLDILGIQKAVLVGHSMGGTIAIKTALKRPERVESLVVEDMVVRKLPNPIVNIIGRFLGTIRRIPENVPAGLSDDETERLICQQLVENGPKELVQPTENRIEVGRSRFGLHLFRRDGEGRLSLKCNIEAIEKALADYDTIASEPEGVFDGPAFFVYGTHSLMKVADDEEHIKQFFPNAVLESIEADHSVHGNKPVEFTDAVLRFLSVPRS